MKKPLLPREAPSPHLCMIDGAGVIVTVVGDALYTTAAFQLEQYTAVVVDGHANAAASNHRRRLKPRSISERQPFCFFCSSPSCCDTCMFAVADLPDADLWHTS